MNIAKDAGPLSELKCSACGHLNGPAAAFAGDAARRLKPIAEAAQIHHGSMF